MHYHQIVWKTLLSLANIYGRKFYFYYVKLLISKSRENFLLHEKRNTIYVTVIYCQARSYL